MEFENLRIERNGIENIYKYYKKDMRFVKYK